MLVPSYISRVGFTRASAIPNGINDGPIARTIIFLAEAGGPWTMNPSIRTLSSVPTGRRVETLATRPGATVGEAVGPGVALAVAVAVGVAVAVAVGVPGGVAVGVAVALGVGLGVGEGSAAV